MLARFWTGVGEDAGAGLDGFVATELDCGTGAELEDLVATELTRGTGAEAGLAGVPCCTGVVGGVTLGSTSWGAGAGACCAAAVDTRPEGARVAELAGTEAMGCAGVTGTGCSGAEVEAGGG